jgi:hypothetical protein
MNKDDYGQKINVNCSGLQCSATVGDNYAHFWLYNKTKSLNKAITGGFVEVNHRVIASKSGSNLSPGDIIAYDYQPDNPFYHGTGGVWDTPYGEWRDNLNQLRAGVTFTASKADENFMKKGTTNNDSTQVKPLKLKTSYVGEAGQDEGWIFWTGVKPTPVAVSLDNSIVSCSGLTCTAQNKTGRTRVEVRIPQTSVRIWSYVIGGLYGNDIWPAGKVEELSFIRPHTNVKTEIDRSQGGLYHFYSPSQSSFANRFDMALEEATLTWDVNVVNPATSCPAIPCSGGLTCCSDGTCKASQAECDTPPPGTCGTNAECGAGACCGVNNRCTTDCPLPPGACTSPACTGSQTCCSSNSGNVCSSDPECNCLGPKSNPAQRCCADGEWRSACSGCTSDNQCASGECCNEEDGTCHSSSEGQYCRTADYDITLSRDRVDIFLTDNSGDQASPEVIVTVDSSNGFNSPVALSLSSSNPTDLLTKITNKDSALTPSTLNRSAYATGSKLVIKVPNNILPDKKTSRTYLLTVKGSAGGIDKYKNLQVNIHGSQWSEK